MNRPSPAVYEELRQREGERQHKEWLKTRPWCNVCDEPIEGPFCYVMDDADPMESCICEDCMTAQLQLMRKAKINTFLREVLAEEIEYNFEKPTPHR